MSELRCWAKSALDFFDGFDVHQAHLNRIDSFARGIKFVEWRGEFGNIRDKITVEVNETEKLLHFSNRCGLRPVGEYLKSCGIRKNTGGRNNMTKIKSLFTEQHTFRGRKLETCGANSIKNGAEIGGVLVSCFRQYDNVVQVRDADSAHKALQYTGN